MGPGETCKMLVNMNFDCTTGKFLFAKRISVKYGFAFLLFFTFIYSASFSQTDPASGFKQQIIPPAPDAANLGRYGEYPVTLSNGLVNISIPIYEIKTGKLTLPISLSYHPGGVRAFDIASSVGLQWTLLAGGAITRSINGIPDESNYGSLTNPMPSPNDPGQYFSCFIARLADSYNEVDGQPDTYFYNLNGSSGKFVFKNIKSTGTPLEILTIPFKPIKISVSSSSFDSFTIVDLDGTLYEFAAPESTTVMSDIGLVSNCNTSWFLTKMISPDKTDSLVFNYTAPSQITSVTGGNSMSERVDVSTLSSRVSYAKSGSTSTHSSRQLSEILFNNGKVSFDYAEDRVDVPGGKRLTAINIYQKNDGSFDKIKAFNLSQSYFEASGSQTTLVAHLINPDQNPDVIKKRLRLDSLTETGFHNNESLSKPPYKFKYEDGTFPFYGSTAQDFTGLYNGANSNENLLFYGFGSDLSGPVISQDFGANRLVNPNTMRVGSLKAIYYPTGGFTEFELEPNQIQYTSTVITPTLASFGPIVLTSFGSTNYDTTFQVTAEMTGINDRVEAVFDLSNINTNSNENQQISTSVSVYDETTNALANFITQTFPSGTFPAQIGIPANTASFHRVEQLELIAGHTYTFSIGSASNFPANTLNRIYASINWQAETGDNDTTEVDKIDYTGGLRIKSIKSYDGIGDTLIKRYNYTKWYYNSNLFNGDVYQMADRFKVRSNRWYRPGSAGAYDLLPYNNYGENFTFQLGSSNNLTTSFEEVEELTVNSDGQSLGKTVYTFRIGIDEIPSYAPYFRSDNGWKRDQILQQRIFKVDDEGNYVKLQETINRYKDTQLESVKSYVSRLETEGHGPDVMVETFRQCGGYDVANSYEWMAFDQYVYRSELDSTITVNYDQDGSNPNTVKVHYEYGNPKHIQLTRKTQTTNTPRVLTSDLKYPLDFSTEPCNQDVCLTNYNAAIANFQTQRATCETDYFQQYQTNKINGNTSAATTAFDNYLGCQTTFHDQVVQVAVAQLNSCQAEYRSCIDSLIDEADPAEKALLVMQRNNVVNPVVERTSGYIDNNSEFVTQAEKTDYITLANGTTEPELIWGFNSSSPVSKNDFNTNSLTYRRQLGRFSGYDNFHNIVQMNKTNDVTTSYLWDYHNEFPIAEVSNATSQEIAYTSFESDGYGNWQISSAARNASEARTGLRSYSLSSGGISKSGLPSNQSFIISLWAKSGSVSVNGSAVQPSSIQSNGWTYYESVLTTSGSSTSIALSGTALIDELRLYPLKSRMVTYTYDPLLGITSTTDPNNVTTQYVYDALGRLSMIKDNDKNIVKHYKYHYQGQD